MKILCVDIEYSEITIIEIQSEYDFHVAKKLIAGLVFDPMQILLMTFSNHGEIEYNENLFRFIYNVPNRPSMKSIEFTLPRSVSNKT